MGKNWFAENSEQILKGLTADGEVWTADTTQEVEHREHSAVFTRSDGLSFGVRFHGYSNKFTPYPVFDPLTQGTGRRFSIMDLVSYGSDQKKFRPEFGATWLDKPESFGKNLRRRMVEPLETLLPKLKVIADRERMMRAQEEKVRERLAALGYRTSSHTGGLFYATGKPDLRMGPGGALEFSRPPRVTIDQLEPMLAVLGAE